MSQSIMENILDGFVSLFGWLCRTLVVELLVYTILYGIGWVILKIITLGRYPQRPRGGKGWLDVELVALVGLLGVVFAVVAFVRLAG